MTRANGITIVFAGMLLGVSFSLHSQKPFISFDVQPGVDCSILIQWAVSAENDSLSFEIERSRDNKTWNRIDQVPVKLTHKYYRLDDQPEDGLNYYRIKQVGKGGKFLYSEIKWLQLNKGVELFIWPNPVRDVVHVRTPYLEGSIDVLDTDGKLIVKIAITNFITDVPATLLSKGIYFLHIRHGKEVYVEKFVKE